MEIPKKLKLSPANVDDALDLNSRLRGAGCGGRSRSSRRSADGRGLQSSRRMWARFVVGDCWVAVLMGDVMATILLAAE
jgi:hypothetical protein